MPNRVDLEALPLLFGQPLPPPPLWFERSGVRTKQAQVCPEHYFRRLFVGFKWHTSLSRFS